jgi:hypothetical protein
MDLNERCGIDAFLIDSCPSVVQALHVLSITETDFKCKSDTDDLHADLTYFLLEKSFSQKY